MFRVPSPVLGGVRDRIVASAGGGPERRDQGDRHDRADGEGPAGRHLAQIAQAPERRRAMRSGTGGCVMNRFDALRPRSGLTM